MVRPILLYDRPVLRQKAKKIRHIDASLQKLIDDMIETMHAANGVGLAAPQIGESLRLVVIGVPDEEVIVLVNPEVVKASGERVIEEGCLSVPGYVGEVKRHVNVTVKARDRHGKEIRIKGTDLLAQALEHEIDHLNGILYFDYLESMDQLRRLAPGEPERQAQLQEADLS